MMRRSLWRVVAVALLTCSTPCFADPPPILDVETLFRNPQKTDFNLSPNGEYVAFMAPWQDRMNLWVKRIGEDTAHRITDATSRSIDGYVWTTDDRLVYRLDEGGDENFRLVSVKRDGGGLIGLTPWEGVSAGIIALPLDDRRHILISHNKRDKKEFDAYRVDVETGESELLVQNPGHVTGYFADHHGVIRLALQEEGPNVRWLYRDAADEPFKSGIVTKSGVISPRLFSYDSSTVIAVSSLHRDKGALVELDPLTGREVKILYENPDVDVAAPLKSDARQMVTGAVFADERRHYVFFDKRREQAQKDLEARLPGFEVSLYDHDAAEDRYVVITWSDRSRADYYIYDIASRSLIHLEASAPWLKSDQLAEVQPISYAARDGRVIHGYLTVPLGVDPKNLPMVVHPHGGPWARDYWEFNPEVQLLANRGYAVLQMNFRGSTGYGADFVATSYGQWGRTMQDDITDGVQEMIKRGVADPKRVGIYGASYGGYATLAGVAFTPDLYAAAVDYVGISNLLSFMKTIPPYWDRKAYEDKLGYSDDPEDIARLKAVSPLFSADKIRTPLMIAHGANDPRVNKAESDQMVAALRARGVEVPYLVEDNEGHGFHNEENRFAFYRAMEQFFGKYLGGRVGPGEDVLGGLKG